MTVEIAAFILAVAGFAFGTIALIIAITARRSTDRAVVATGREVQALLDRLAELEAQLRPPPKGLS